MSNITFRLSDGSRRVVNRVKRTDRSMERGVQSGKLSVGRSLVRATKQDIMKGKKSGRIYKIQYASGGTRIHQSSAPGETHANLTGALKRSLAYKSSGSDLEFGYGVGGRDAPPYAHRIEFGGRSSSGGRGFVVKLVGFRRSGVIKPRPTLMNNLKSHNRDTITYIQAGIGKALRR